MPFYDKARDNYGRQPSEHPQAEKIVKGVGMQKNATKTIGAQRTKLKGKTKR